MMISKEAEKLLLEIINHESDSEYWSERFEKADHEETTILRGCFKELKDNQLINTMWADNIPFIINVLKDGYLYQQHKDEQKKAEKALTMSKFEKSLYELLERANFLSAPNRMKTDSNGKAQNLQANIWMDDVQTFYSAYLKTHPLSSRIDTLLFQRKFDELVAALTSISKDTAFIDKINGVDKVEVPKYQAKTLPEYDVFISHANKDKKELIEELYHSLDMLGIKIFYDKESLEWGDNWKERILNGVKKAEFAIIVISENFFDREWTEKELSEFLNRQNRNGQKLILPIVHNISMKQLQDKYPTVANIQALDSKKYTCDQIALLFAKQLIKRLKAN
ncbi:MAG: toll/interleukin-1 receptor domain-containing protein [Ruminococcus flavefaciens]|nr:toll/interleukin-1 receptor domain-containing protein [Ruminococcus flavefaciens]MCM1061725.1 toll/interleukin-1 receptor domain-containing protein [Eubacterium sp.]